VHKDQRGPLTNTSTCPREVPGRQQPSRGAHPATRCTVGDQWKGEVCKGRWNGRNTHSTYPCAGGATVSCAPRSAAGREGGRRFRCPVLCVAKKGMVVPGASHVHDCTLSEGVLRLAGACHWSLLSGLPTQRKSVRRDREGLVRRCVHCVDCA
jgi:hypothetical protein